MQATAGGNDNTAVGAYALKDNVASGNTGVGRNAGRALTSGHSNTALGYDALYTATTGNYCTALGHSALRVNTAEHNTAVG